MKKYIYTGLLLSLSWLNSSSQTIIKIEDPHITAQENRMVFKRWGNFLPNPRYKWGIQTNFHYTMTWGWLAPKQNGRYRKGADIRPLGVKGDQTQRMVYNSLLKSESDKEKKEADDIGSTALSELYYYAGAFSTIDPLWNLYYKIELKDVLNFEKNRPLVQNAQTLKYLKDTGITEWYENEMERLQDRLTGAFKTNMDRGSRILNYHRIMKEYYGIREQLKQHILASSTLIKLNNQVKKQNSGEDLENTSWEKRSEEDMIKKIMQNSKS